MKNKILKMFTGMLLTAVAAACVFKPVQVFADDDEWDEWDDVWYDDDNDTLIIDDGGALIIIDGDDDVYIYDYEEENRRAEEERRRAEEERRRAEEEHRRAEEERRRAEEERRRAEEERKRAEADRNRRVTGIRVSTNSLTVKVGEIIQVGVQVQPENAGNRGVTMTSSNPSVATVDMYANIKGISPGSAVITARTNENGYAADVYVTVTGQPTSAPLPAAPAASSQRDANFCATAAAQIMAAPFGGTANFPAMSPMSFDRNVANAMSSRPDVTVATAFPYQGHTYILTLPAGYNLSARLDKNGYADWTTLLALKSSDPLIQVVMAN